MQDTPRPAPWGGQDGKERPERYVSVQMLQQQLVSERSLWSSAIDQRVDGLLALVYGLETRLDTRLAELHGPLACDRGEKVDLRLEAGQLAKLARASIANPADPSAVSTAINSRHGEASSPSTTQLDCLSTADADTLGASAPTAPALAGALQVEEADHLSALEAMCKAVEALQEQERMQRAEMRSAQSRHGASIKELQAALLEAKAEVTQDVEALKADMSQRTGEIRALKCQGEAKSAELRPLGVQLFALQQGHAMACGGMQALQGQCCHAMALQQGVVQELNGLRLELMCLRSHATTLAEMALLDAALATFAYKSSGVGGSGSPKEAATFAERVAQLHGHLVTEESLNAESLEALSVLRSSCSTAAGGRGRECAGADSEELSQWEPSSIGRDCMSSDEDSCRGSDRRGADGVESDDDTSQLHTELESTGWSTHCEEEVEDDMTLAAGCRCL